MNLRERLQIRTLVNLIVSVIERLVNILIKLTPKQPDSPKPSPGPVKPHRPKPLKTVIDTINNIVPLPWRNK
jgi:hypothetical protein